MIGGETVGLHLNSGVPVVQIVGAWSDSTERLLSETVSRLISAGHLEIIVNLAAAVGIPGPERSWLDGLSILAASLRSRCGRLDVVGTVEQIKDGLKRQAHSCWSWATSEEEAVYRVKGLPTSTRSAVSIVNARLR